MENILVITLGTRDIQLDESKLSEAYQLDTVDNNGRLLFKLFNKENHNVCINLVKAVGFPGFYSFASARIDGEVLCSHPELFKDLFSYPLIDPVINYLRELNIRVTSCMLVYTNQSIADGVSERNWKNDTLYFGKYLSAEYLPSALKIDHVDIWPYEVNKHVTNIDYLYQEFDSEKDGIFGLESDEIEKVYLLPQGGIDQINTALTLKLIEYFQGRVVQLQSAEDSRIEERVFPSLFLNNINKHKIEKLLSQFDFNSASVYFARGSIARILCEYASKRLYLDHKNISFNPALLSLLQENRKLKGSSHNPSAERELHLQEMFRLRDAFISAKVYLLRSDYGALLWRIFTISEIFFKFMVDSKIPGYSQCHINNKYGNQPNSKLRKKLQDYFIRRDYKGDPVSELENTFIGKGKALKKLVIDSPTRLLSAQVYLKMVKNGDFGDVLRTKSSLIERDIIVALEYINQKRNDVSHALEPLSYNQISQILPTNVTIEQVINTLGDVLEVIEYGDFSWIRDAILLEL